MSPLSKSPSLVLLARAISIIPIALGINAFLRPAAAIALFGFDMPSLEADRKAVEALMMIYGARDVLMGLAIYVTATLGSPHALGWMLVISGAVAGVDGYACWTAGTDPFSHWAGVPVLTAFGAIFVYDW